MFEQDLILVGAAGVVALVFYVLGWFGHWWSTRPLVIPPEPEPAGPHRKHRKPAMFSKQVGNERIYHCACGDRIFRKVLPNGREVNA